MGASSPFLLLLAGALAGCAAPEPVQTAPVQTAPGREVPEAAEWTDLFAPEHRSSWRASEFGGGEELELDAAGLTLPMGTPLAGAHYVGPCPRDGYEVELEAARLAGGDFFVGLTFPVGDAHLTLILGGWGGALVGLSCLDGRDASDNETTGYRAFETGRYYRARVRVEGGWVRTWLDGELLWEVRTEARRLELRPEVLPSRPLGLASFATRGHCRSLRIRELAATP